MDENVLVRAVAAHDNHLQHRRAVRVRPRADEEDLSAAINGMSVPAASAAKVTVAHAHGDALPAGTVTIPGLALPRASMGDIASDSVSAGGEADPYIFTADAGVFGGTLTVTPSATIDFAELRITNVRATASIGSVALQNVVLPYDVFSLTLSQLGIETIAIPALEVS